MEKTDNKTLAQRYRTSAPGIRPAGPAFRRNSPVTTSFHNRRIAGEVSLLSRGTMGSGVRNIPAYLKKYECSPGEVSLLTRGTMGSRVKNMPAYLKKYEYSPAEVSLLTRGTMTSGMKKTGSDPKKMSSTPEYMHITTHKESQFRDLSSTLNRKGPLWPIPHYL